MNELGGKIPFVVGVVGHRDIDADSETKAIAGFRDLLTSHRNLFPETPILLINGLAEGADQLSARVAHSIEGVFVATLLPMKIEEYLNTFSSERHQADFLDLISLSIFVQNSSEGEKYEDISDAFRGNTRQISNSADLLVAFWDGVATQLVGGTADTIYYKLKKLHKPKALSDVVLNQKEFGAAMVIPINRISNSTKALDLTPYSLTPITVERREMSVAKDEIAKAKAKWNSNRFVDLDDSKGSIYRLTETSHIMAKNFQRKFIQSLSAILLTSFLTIFAVEIQSRSDSKIVSILTIVIGLLAATIFQISRRMLIKDNFHKYQAIAEAGDIQALWINTGVMDPVSDYLLVGVNTHADSLRSILRTAHFLDLDIGRQIYPEKPELFLKSWIARQISLRKGSGSQKGRVRQYKSLLKTIRILTNLCVAFSVVIWGYFSISLIAGINSSISTKSLLQSMFVIALAAAATISSYSYLLALEEYISRDEKALEALLHAQESLEIEFEELSTEVHARELSKSLGLIFLHETSEWYVRNFDRKIKGILQ